jgi:hypothetical protein
VPNNAVYVNDFPLISQEFLKVLEKVLSVQGLAETVFYSLQNRVHQFNSGRGLHQYYQVIGYYFLERTLGISLPLRSP